MRSLPEGEPRVLVEDARRARYLPTGHLVYLRGETLFADSFDPAELALRGSPVPLVDGVRPSRHSAHFDVSDTGTLVYLRGTVRQRGRLVWVDREGRTEPLPLEPAEIHVVNLSPDGTKLAFDMGAVDSSEVWLYDLSIGTLSRFTFHPGPDSDPVWSPDGKRIYFSSARDGARNVYWKSSDGSGEVIRVTETEAVQWPQGLSPDGGVLLIDEIGESSMDILRLDLEASSNALPFLRTEAVERLPAIAPNGRFVAYESFIPGARQIYVRTFPEGEGPWQVSHGGGLSPRWSPDGRELFYLQDGALMAVSVETEASFRVLGTRKLFEGSYLDSSHSYDVSPDGERFLMIEASESSATRGGSDLVVVLDWFEEMKRLAPREE